LKKVKEEEESQQRLKIEKAAIGEALRLHIHQRSSIQLPESILSGFPTLTSYSSMAEDRTNFS